MQQILRATSKQRFHGFYFNLSEYNLDSQNVILNGELALFKQFAMLIFLFFSRDNT